VLDARGVSALGLDGVLAIDDKIELMAERKSPPSAVAAVSTEVEGTPGVGTGGSSEDTCEAVVVPPKSGMLGMMGVADTDSLEAVESTEGEATPGVGAC